MKSSLKPAERNGRLPSLARECTWYALCVPPQKEFAAQEILKRRGIATFCPFESVWRRTSRYTKEKELKHYPVMPRYVFAGFDAEPSWFHVFSIPLIRAVVGFDGQPAKIRDMVKFISGFRNGLKRPEAERFMRTHREYGVGDIATVIDGPLAGRSVVVENIARGHAFFRMEMFGGEMVLNLPVGSLEAA
jgi:transcription antitermination factor NusG